MSWSETKQAKFVHIKQELATWCQKAILALAVYKYRENNFI